MIYLFDIYSEGAAEVSNPVGRGGKLNLSFAFAILGVVPITHLLVDLRILWLRKLANYIVFEVD